MLEESLIFKSLFVCQIVWLLATAECCKYFLLFHLLFAIVLIGFIFYFFIKGKLSHNEELLKLFLTTDLICNFLVTYYLLQGNSEITDFASYLAKNTAMQNYYQIIFALVAVTVSDYLMRNITYERFNEERARYSLDRMPIEGMSIDADLNQKVIDINIAEKRRKELFFKEDYFEHSSEMLDKCKDKYLFAIINFLLGIFINMDIYGCQFKVALANSAANAFVFALYFMLVSLLVNASLVLLGRKLSGFI